MTNLQPTLDKKLGNPEDESLEGNLLDEANFEKMIDAYLQRIELPAVNPARKMFLCPIGLVGAGKSTVVKPISKDLGLARVSGDEIRKLLQENGFNWTRTIEIAFHVIQMLVAKGYSIAVDSDCVGPNISQTIKSLAEAKGYRVFYIHINPPESFILNKLRSFKHSWLFKDADDAIANYERRKPMHQNISFDFIYTFDTSRDDLEQQISEAEEVIKNML